MRRGELLMEDCFAYGGGKCQILSVKTCEYARCGFYKTGEQLQMEREKALMRICSLPEHRRKHLFATYNLKDGREGT